MHCTYYAPDSNGVKSVSVSNPDFSNAQTIVASGKINGIKVRGIRLWYNDGQRIRAVCTKCYQLYFKFNVSMQINVDGSNPTIISAESPSEATCVCSGGYNSTIYILHEIFILILFRYHGNRCDECFGSIQWQNGVTSCVPIDATGWPISCSAGIIFLLSTIIIICKCNNLLI